MKESEELFTVNFEKRIDIAEVWFYSIMVFYYFFILSFYENLVRRLNRCYYEKQFQKAK